MLVCAGYQPSCTNQHDREMLNCPHFENVESEDNFSRFYLELNILYISLMIVRTLSNDLKNFLSDRGLGVFLRSGMCKLLFVLIRINCFIENRRDFCLC